MSDDELKTLQENIENKLEFPNTLVSQIEISDENRVDSTSPPLSISEDVFTEEWLDDPISTDNFVSDDTHQSSLVIPEPNLSFSGTYIYLLPENKVKEIVISGETNLENDCSSQHDTHDENTKKGESSESEDSEDSVERQRKIVEDMHGYSVPLDKMEFMAAKKVLKSIKKKLKTAQQKNRRLERRVEDLKSVLEKLKRKRR